MCARMCAYLCVHSRQERDPTTEIFWHLKYRKKHTLQPDQKRKRSKKIHTHKRKAKNAKQEKEEGARWREEA